MATFDELGDPKYISLTTFRKTGVGVPTAVWAARDGDALVVTTLARAGKTKRVRNNPEVTLSPCSMSGKVAAGAAVYVGRAEVIEDAEGMAAAGAALAAKYGFQYRIATRASKRSADPENRRVILRITAV